MTKRQIQQAQKKVEVAIDKMVALQDMGFGNDAIARILEMLNKLHNSISDMQ